tara:strand:+ start:156 stop:335 length:180 start_codon:yes stop_codon:yes gene_type:complete
MNKLDSFKDSPLQKKYSSEEVPTDNEIKDKVEKVLCNHCGRTAGNKRRCLGFCVADNDY